MKRFFNLVTIVGMCIGAHAAEVVVRKSAGEANPSLAVVAFNGPQDLRGVLEASLARCDWFSVVNNGPVAFQVRAAAQRTESGTALRVQVFAGNRPVADVSESMRGDDRLLVARVVDSLVQKIFGVPGPCSSPIAFVMAQGGRKEIFLTYLDSAGMRQLTRNGSISTEPSWGNSTNSLFYTYYEPTRVSVMQLDLAADRQRRVAYFAGLNAGAALSPDGRRIALCLSRDGAVELYTMAVSGGGLRRLTRDAAVESSPCWSPEGNRICYVSDAGGRPQLYVASSDGGGGRRLVNDYVECVSPDWSATSNMICTAVRDGGRYVIGVVDMNQGTRSLRIVTPGAGNWEAPSWSRDGRHIICTREVAGGMRELCMVDSRLGTVIKLTRPAKISLPDCASR